MSRRERGTLDFNTLQKQLLSSGQLFTDPQFPPNDRSLYFSNRPPTNGRYIGKVVWKRPPEIVPNPQLVVNKFNRHDIDQGALGNCWFIAGAAILASTYQQQFQKIIPQDEGFEPDRYTGMFRFNFWWYGKWVEVIIDDFLPTDGFRLIYSSNRERPEEFWPSLLEKAYAKLRGNYEALVGGNIQDALVDMTGGISEVINLRVKNKVLPELYSLLQTSFKMKTLMGASISLSSNSSSNKLTQKNGLIMQHSYSITGFRQIPSWRGTVNLLRLRNPWGKVEWKGAWSDGSAEMNMLSKQLKEDLNFREMDEGEFWMSHEDFILNFDEINLCHLQPDALISELSDNNLQQLWNVTVYHDAWIRGVTAGGCGNPPNENLYWKNPQFYVTLESPDVTLGRGDDCTLIVSLMEKEKDNQSKITIGFKVYKLKSPELRPLDNSRAPKNALLLSNQSGIYVSEREVTKRFELKPGTYVIIPSTFLPHEEAEFMLRLFTEKRANSGVLDGKVESESILLSAYDFIGKAFERHAGSDNQLDAFELQIFLDDVSTSEFGEPLKFSLDSCRSLLTLIDEDKSGFLGLGDAKRAWKEIKAYREVFKQFDVNRTNTVDTYELATMFSKLGFSISRNVLTSIVRRYGGRDSQISLPDFVLVICKLTFLFASFRQQQIKKGVNGDSAEFTRNEFLEVAMFT